VGRVLRLHVQRARLEVLGVALGMPAP
jgi:hypothetical protein